MCPACSACPCLIFTTPYVLRGSTVSPNREDLGLWSSRSHLHSGFISIDCGIADNSSYTDGTTGIYYVSDAEYIDTGVSKSISPQYKTNGLAEQFSNVRSFPQGIRNCYTLTLSQIDGQAKYLVRARFMYGNYDGVNRLPKFDLYLGVNYWDTVELSDMQTILNVEIIHTFSSDYTYICLVNTGRGTPFVSALELRLVNNNIYQTESGSLALSGRFDMRSSNSNDQVLIRYKDDIFDRIWDPPFTSTWSELRTSENISTTYQNIFKIPSAVMTTAVMPQDANGSLGFNWKPLSSDTGYYVYLHFADLQSNESREFNIYLNGTLWYTKPVQASYFYTNTIYSTTPSWATTLFNVSIEKTDNSTLPPILNALEVYTVKDLSSLQTYRGDVDAIKRIKSVYGVEKNWQGDPCTPENYTWEGLNCINDSSDTSRIVSLNLSLSGLTGKISNSIFNLVMLQSLDLSNNSLTGEVPDFLTQMQKLTFLKLTGNNLTGSVPTELIERSKSGSLFLSVEGNPNLCMPESCGTKPEKKKNSMVVPIVASIAAVSALLIAFAILWVFIKRRKSPQQQVASVTKAGAAGSNNRDTPLKSKKQQFTYSEVLQITGNFQRVLGKGGFGTVYHGYLEDTQVAVKMLSPSSGQGYKQFKAEAELLMRVHHRNLTSLVGYCDEGDKLGLIYEYMANGDLETHLSDRNHKFLSWDLRLEIALDAAQGLEYLHTGCKPPIIHRDIKSTNILLNDEFQAKLADFGLSKVFPTEGSTHVSTTFAGTPGYLDPEFKLNEKSDVFSFGVVLLEMITGRPAIARNQEKTQTHLSQWVSHVLKTKGDVRDVVDPRLGRDFDLNSVWKAVDIAMECVSATSTARPTMNAVVIELQRCLAMEKASMKKDYQGESNYDSIEMSLLNIETTEMKPIAR